MLDHGTDPSTRWALLKERLDAMKRIWTTEIAEYAGQFVRFGPMQCWPKPVQKPYPPIFLGGNSKKIPRMSTRMLVSAEWC
jgi:alkanesulfonate monooxygenase SsuD/methylene tetrahydromethanopterin reductase-like flavin-dependent oxidoreductase (luciferase family)